MELSAKIIILFAAVIITGLSAGFFYAWEVSVIQGNKLVSDKTYVETMQSINRAIINPAFLLIFIGAALLLPVSSYMQFKSGANLSFWFMLSASVIYIVGTFGVTMGGNVPMNDALDAINIQGLSAEDLRTFRTSYEGRWNQLHTIRTMFAVISFVLSLLAVFVRIPHT
jgi:uncharacterized membrane protein